MPGHEEWHGVILLGGIVLQYDAFVSCKRRARLFDRHRPLRLYPNRLAVCTHYRHPHAHGTHFDVGVHDFARFVIHLHLLLRISVVGEDVDLRDQVVGQLVEEFLHHRLLSLRQLHVLRPQLIHGLCTRTTGRLVGRHMHTPNVRQFLNRIQRHNHLNRRTVRVGNDTLRTFECILRVDFGHYQRNVRIHTECAGIIDHHRTVLRDRLCKSCGRSSSS